MQAQCQKELKGLNKQVESKQADLGSAQQELQRQQKVVDAVQKRIAEAERRQQAHMHCLATFSAVCERCTCVCCTLHDFIS